MNANTKGLFICEPKSHSRPTFLAWRHYFGLIVRPEFPGQISFEAQIPSGNFWPGMLFYTLNFGLENVSAQNFCLKTRPKYYYFGLQVNSPLEMFEFGNIFARKGKYHGTLLSALD